MSFQTSMSKAMAAVVHGQLDRLQQEWQATVATARLLNMSGSRAIRQLEREIEADIPPADQASHASSGERSQISTAYGHPGPAHSNCKPSTSPRGVLSATPRAYLQETSLSDAH
eukprot:gnl/TRDRNA2_/TRDRNA2_116679_c2_seq1.p1 gnl/TRDRNA2_/TRDRNA2_116679_c2~~gnl/TRDRNA2_/TRDRNA2_116679_c2_seq1.p1  ORF type:complete len:114 (-),score=7.45 gnl/TRDRNA2_/TRDRNA2_116679_c2_seq1:143-484(-)